MIGYRSSRIPPHRQPQTAVPVTPPTVTPPPPDNDAPTKPDRLLRIADVKAIVGLGTSTIYRRMEDRKHPFPKPVQISPGTVRWRESSITRWMDSLKEVEDED